MDLRQTKIRLTNTRGNFKLQHLQDSKG